MTAKYFLVRGTSAAEVGRMTGLTAHDTPQGTLVEPPVPQWKIDRMMDKVNDALYPNRCKCKGVLHEPGCRAWGT